jgi:hypothetical protein
MMPSWQPMDSVGGSGLLRWRTSRRMRTMRWRGGSTCSSWRWTSLMWRVAPRWSSSHRSYMWSNVSKRRRIAKRVGSFRPRRPTKRPWRGCEGSTGRSCRRRWSSTTRRRTEQRRRRLAPQSSTPCRTPPLHWTPTFGIASQRRWHHGK